MIKKSKYIIKLLKVINKFIFRLNQNKIKKGIKVR